MALARIKNWVYEKLTYSDLNSEFNNILNNPGSLICPITFHLTFTDATYDIGASGATRPRDLFLSRNATIGGTLAVTGVSSLGVINTASFATTATAAGTTTLVLGSAMVQEFTGTTTQTVVMPEASTLTTSWTRRIINNSTGALTINSSGGNLIQTLNAGERATITCVLASGTTAASWAVAMGGKTALISQFSAAGVGNAADTTDDTLFTYSLPLNALPTNGKSIHVRANGYFAANGNDKVAKFWFAGAEYSPVGGSGGFNNKSWIIDADIVRIDATHVFVSAALFIVGSYPYIVAAANAAVSDLSANASIIKVTGSSPTTGAANDVICYNMILTFNN